MESSLVVVSAFLVLSADACFLLDHQTRPPRTAKRTTARRSPCSFMGYLLFHHVAMPKPTTASGKITTLSQKTEFSFCADRFRGRSSGDLGRIEIRSSSAESQLIILRNRSRLPLKRMKLLPSHWELPTTTKRPCGEPLNVPAAPSRSGPFLSFLGSIRTSPELRLVVAKLFSLVENSFCTVVLSVFLISRVRESGKAVAVPFSGSVIGCGSYSATSGTASLRPKIWPMPETSSARSLLTVTPHPASTASRVLLSSIGLRPVANGGSNRNSALPPLST